MRARSREPSPWAGSAGPDPEELAAQAAAVALEERPEPDAVLGEAVVKQGPQVPLHTTGAGTREALLPPASGQLMVLGLHGGSGASTLAALLGQEVLEHPTVWRQGDPLPAGWVVAVARIHRRGLDALTGVASAWSHGETGEQGRLLGVVLVDDGPRPSKAQVQAAKSLTGAVPRVWRIPWVEEWRERLATEEEVRCPRRVRATTKNIRKTHRDAVTNRKELS